MIATYINALAVIIGSIIGLIFKKFITDRFKTIIFQGTGLATIVIGILMVVKCKHPVLTVFAIIIGGVIGGLIRIESGIERIGEWLKNKFSKNNQNDRFTEGFVNSSLTFCVGAMTVIGAINAATGNYDILLTKSIMDGSISIIFASILGFGVVFSSITIVLYQGGITLLSSKLLFVKKAIYINEISAVGGILIIGIGINLLEIKKIRIVNFIPSIFLIVLFIFIKINIM